MSGYSVTAYFEYRTAEMKSKSSRLNITHAQHHDVPLPLRFALLQTTIAVLMCTYPVPFYEPHHSLFEYSLDIYEMSTVMRDSSEVRLKIAVPRTHVGPYSLIRALTVMH